MDPGINKVLRLWRWGWHVHWYQNRSISNRFAILWVFSFFVCLFVSSLPFFVDFVCVGCFDLLLCICMFVLSCSYCLFLFLCLWCCLQLLLRWYVRDRHSFFLHECTVCNVDSMILHCLVFLQLLHWISHHLITSTYPYPLLSWCFHFWTVRQTTCTYMHAYMPTNGIHTRVNMNNQMNHGCALHAYAYDDVTWTWQNPYIVLGCNKL